MKVRIVAIGKESAWYEDRKELVGKIGLFTFDNLKYANTGGFRSGWFTENMDENHKFDYGTDYYFFRIKVHQLKENEE